MELKLEVNAWHFLLFVMRDWAVVGGGCGVLPSVSIRFLFGYTGLDWSLCSTIAGCYCVCKLGGARGRVS